jgi:hypothetical protein
LVGRSDSVLAPRRFISSSAAVVVTATIKAFICTVIGMLPIVLWAPASALIRRVWPGFRSA